MSNSIMKRSIVGGLAVTTFIGFVLVVRGGSVVSPFQKPEFADTETSVNFAVPSFEG